MKIKEPLLPNQILRQPAAAKYTGLPESSLAKLRLTNDGPPFVRLAARALGYRVKDLDAWLESRVVGKVKKKRA